MERIEEFTIGGKSIMYIDFSGLRSNDDFIRLADIVKPLIAKYPKGTLYTITNVEDVRFDSKSKDIVINYVEHNRPYVKYGVIVGLDGVKKIMIHTIFKVSGRKNVYFAFSKEQAMEWLLDQEF